MIALETDYPAAIRRQVSFCEAVYDGSAVVEGVTARLVPALADAETDTETYSGENDTPAAHIVSESGIVQPSKLCLKPERSRFL